MLRYYADMLAVASLFLIAEGVATLTLPEFEAEPPIEAAERALEGVEHAPIAKVERQPAGAMTGPTMTFYRAFEQPQPVPGGCRRTVWTFIFSGPPEPASPQVLVETRLQSEVGLASQDGCENAAFARALALEQQALRALHRLGEIAAGQHPVEFDCSAELDDQVCRNAESIRSALASETALRVSQQGSVATIVLEPPRGLQTWVMFDVDAPRRVSVRKRIPPPF